MSTEKTFLQAILETLIQASDAEAFLNPMRTALGYRVCCQVPSYKEHTKDCYLMAMIHRVRQKIEEDEVSVPKKDLQVLLKGLDAYISEYEGHKRKMAAEKKLRNKYEGLL